MYRIIPISLAFIFGLLINSASAKSTDEKLVPSNEFVMVQSLELDILQTQTQEMKIPSSINLSQLVQEKLERENCKIKGTK